ncbi:TetR/AcrR family transcriptional regulator [Chryseobacterium populi]|uniref:HTH tetR-type domain-containing protein n=1 Tax=Chryseobacterium populi TaxID=1144316 RepID=J2K664_9FLAO|nr:TetR/AcrR family transcriptional regulator [Chryseobacterium populi]EJL68713.1 hypothetical protein PMI13_03539 [Chryseobacterium populi]
MNTKQKIKQSAKALIFREGKFDFRLSDISEKAEVAHSVLHYYFRTRMQLLSTIEDEMITEFMENGKSWLISDIPLREKVELYISSSYQRLSVYPFADLYLLSRINAEIERYSEDFRNAIVRFSSEIKQAIRMKIIKSYQDPIHFIINMISLTAHPFILTGFLYKTSVINGSEVSNILEQQKKLIIKNLFD